jgi:hypothetical protein
MKYHTEVNEAVEWLYPGMQLDFSATILCSNNNSVNMWNSIAQEMNPERENILHSKDSFSEVDDPKGHLRKMLSPEFMNGFRKCGIPDHELKLKVNDICLVTRAIHGLGIANNSRVRIVCVHTHCVEVITIGEYERRLIRIPRISFRFRLPYGKSYQLTRMQFPLRLAYAMTYNKSQSQTLVNEKDSPTRQSHRDVRPPQKGLYNNGVICFNNALLQTFTSLRHLTTFMNDPPQYNKEAYPLNHAFCTILNLMVSQDVGQVSTLDPSSFVELFLEKRTTFEDTQSEFS